MAFDLSADTVATFLGVNDAPREPAPSKPGNGAHVIQKHNSLVTNTQNIVNSLGENISTYRSEVSGRLQAMTSDIAVLGAEVSAATRGGGCIFSTTSYEAQPGQRIIFSDYYLDTPHTLFLPSSPQVGDEISFMHLNFEKRLFIKNQNLDIFRFKGAPKYQIDLVPVYEMVSLVFIGYNSNRDITEGWVPTRDGVFVDPAV